MPKLRLFELFLIEFLIYLMLWLWDEYIASLLTIIMTAIFTAILIIAAIAELIEKSKVPRSYFLFMLGSVLIPLLVGFVFVVLLGGKLMWMEV